MKLGGATLILAAFLIGALWVSHGADLGTREKVPVTVKSIDDFGDETESIEWKAPSDFPVTGFHLGLDYAGPAAGLLFGAGALMIFVSRRRRAREG